MTRIPTKIMLALAALAAPLVSGMAENGPDFALKTGPYLAAGFGGDWIDTSSITFFNSRVDTHWAGGFGGFAAIGYRFDYGFRAELEGSGRQDMIHKFGVNPWFGTQWDTSAMANLLYDIATGTRFTPYVGGGIGLSHLSWGNNFRANLNQLPYTYDDSDSKFAWQAITGVAFYATPALAVTLDARLKGSRGYNFPSTGPAFTNISNFDYQTRSLFLGLRYSFD